MKTKPTYLALGDSYTIGEGVRLEDSFPYQLQLAQKLNFSLPKIIAKTGWRTDELLCAIYKEDLLPKYDLVTLLIGVNNQYQGRPISVYKNEFISLLKLATELGKKVIVISIPDYGFTPFGGKKPGITEDINQFNAINQEIAFAFKAEYISVTEISRLAWEDHTLLVEDLLHPSGKQYEMWVEEVLNKTSFKI